MQGLCPGHGSAWGRRAPSRWLLERAEPLHGVNQGPYLSRVVALIPLNPASKRKENQRWNGSLHGGLLPVPESTTRPCDFVTAPSVTLSLALSFLPDHHLGGVSQMEGSRFGGVKSTLPVPCSLQWIDLRLTPRHPDLGVRVPAARPGKNCPPHHLL